jgi:plasmid stability protein
MAEQTLTLTLPEVLYHHLRDRAAGSNRTVEDEIMEILTTAVPVAGELPAELEKAISPLSVLDDEALWRAARTRLGSEDAARLEELHEKREREGLSAAESDTLAGLVRQYERALLVRAQAAALLKQRGHDVSVLLGAS